MKQYDFDYRSFLKLNRFLVLMDRQDSDARVRIEFFFYRIVLLKQKHVDSSIEGRLQAGGFE